MVFGIEKISDHSDSVRPSPFLCVHRPFADLIQEKRSWNLIILSYEAMIMIQTHQSSKVFLWLPKSTENSFLSSWNMKQLNFSFTPS